MFKKILLILQSLFFASSAPVASHHNRNKALDYVQKGLSLMGQGRHEEAIKNYDTAIDLYPNDANFYYAKAIIFGELEKHERVLSYCDKAITLKLKNSMPYYNKAVVLSNLEQKQEALEVCNRPTNTYKLKNFVITVMGHTN
ncbi:TPR-repeat-containing protein [Candidatus Phycorickettsia trachydisci]|uniref:TPR-repeat-containing protein n=1 Tax=Candidatus Phycorickettsia trachydisci TaxID=2115978 RepID=A0A2P1P9V0_9RICK|nr:tetratricopeptide repeat protein [Candidatus Phycorickettsia trachydisci]AVP88039.1 TPR-repeat-containing protein [Candidatus Phycorickettsia trachydisci]